MLNFALVEYYEREGQKEEAETVIRTHLEKSYEELLKVESMLPAEKLPHQMQLLRLVRLPEVLRTHKTALHLKGRRSMPCVIYSN
jgi:uncharacterized protein HemY